MTRWEQLYREDRRAEGAPPSRCAGRAADLFGRYSVGRALDLGCGAGRDTAALAAGARLVVGADAARSGLAIARGRAPGPLVLADARALPFGPSSFDGVYCYGLLHEFTSPSAEEDVRRVAGEVWRVLRPGGVLVLAVLAGDPGRGLPHVRLFTDELFREATRGLTPLERETYTDIGCTGSANYTVHYGAFERP